MTVNQETQMDLDLNILKKNVLCSAFSWSHPRTCNADNLGFTSPQISSQAPVKNFLFSAAGCCTNGLMYLRVF